MNYKLSHLRWQLESDGGLKSSATFDGNVEEAFRLPLTFGAEAPWRPYGAQKFPAHKGVARRRTSPLWREARPRRGGIQ